MQKLRDLYKETQRNTNDDFDKVTHDRMKKILAYANREQQNILDKQQFGLLNQIVFYQEKFREIVDTFDKAIQQGYKRPKIQTQLQVILKDNYADNGEYREQNRPQPILNDSPSNLKIKKPVDEGQNAKEVIKNYFDLKNEQIKKSKIGFKSVLEDIPYAPKKFAVKPVIQNQSNLNKDEINKYKAEISKLKHELSNREAQKQFNMELLQIEKKQYQQRIKQLLKKVEFLQSQNSRLKDQSVKSFPIGAHQHFIPHQQPPRQNHINYEQLQQRYDDYDPYVIYYRNNDLGKIKNRHLQKQPNNQKDVIKAHTYNHPLKQEMANQKFIANNFNILQQIPQQLSSRKNSEDFSNSQKFGKDNAFNEAKSIANKSKVSFFKQSMIIYRGQDVQIAVKSVDIIKLSSKKVVFYILNKEKSQKMVQFQYKVDPNYYELQTKKKASVLQGLQQAREQIEIRLTNPNDLDNLIEANLTIRSKQGMKQLQFLVPALFIQFIEKRPQIQKGQFYTNQKIFPVKQFSSLHYADELIPIQKLYGERYEAGRVYAISRSHQGYIFMRWIGRSLQIQTIPAFKLLIAYLMLREY